MKNIKLLLLLSLITLSLTGCQSKSTSLTDNITPSNNMTTTAIEKNNIPKSEFAKIDYSLNNVVIGETIDSDGYIEDFPEDLSTMINKSSNIICANIIDNGTQFSEFETSEPWTAYKAEIEKVYKGSLNVGDTVNVVENCGVTQKYKFGENLNIINLPESNIHTSIRLDFKT